MDFSRSVKAVTFTDFLIIFRSRNTENSSTAIARFSGGPKPLRAHSHKSSTGSTGWWWSKPIGGGGGGATKAGESVIMSMKSEAALDTKKPG